MHTCACSGEDNCLQENIVYHLGFRLLVSRQLRNGIDTKCRGVFLRRNGTKMFTGWSGEDINSDDVEIIANSTGRPGVPSMLLGSLPFLTVGGNITVNPFAISPSYGVSQYLLSWNFEQPSKIGTRACR